VTLLNVVVGAILARRAHAAAIAALTLLAVTAAAAAPWYACAEHGSRAGHGQGGGSDVPPGERVPDLGA
jgi:hypothetical protein